MCAHCCFCCLCCYCCLVAGVTQFAFIFWDFVSFRGISNVQQRRIRIWDSESVLINILCCALIFVCTFSFYYCPSIVCVRFIFNFILLLFTIHTHRDIIIIHSQMNMCTWACVDVVRVRSFMSHSHQVIQSVDFCFVVGVRFFSHWLTEFLCNSVNSG